MPEVSVIIPNYNHAAFLKERIETVLGQTYNDIELIILDDNSPDNSRDIINSYKDNPKVKHIVFNIENSNNTFEQWEKGIKLAAGNYIWLAESDDKAAPDFLESLMPGFYQNPNVCISFCESFWINANDNEVRKIKINTPSFTMAGEDFIRKYMLTKCRIYNVSMAVIKKSVFLKAISPEYKQFKICGDYYMWIQLLLLGDVFYLNRKLNYYRRHSNSVSHKSEKEGLILIEGMKVLHLINRNIVLSREEIWKTTKFLSNRLAHQYIIIGNISKKNCLSVYNQLKKFSKKTSWIFPIYIMKKIILYPLYIMKRWVAQKIIAWMN